VEPQGRDAMVPVSQPVSFVVHLKGRAPDPTKPDAVRLLFRYNQAEPVYIERRLERGDSDKEWLYRLPAFEVQNGFWYKIAGGDFETEEHRIQVRSSPLVTHFDVRCKYRPYLGRPDQVNNDPNVEAIRGTEITLRARTNRRLASGKLQIDGEVKPVTATIPADAPDTLQFKFIVDRDGLYRIQFTSIEDEPSGDSLPYRITAIPDLAPTVELTQPGKDVTLPANGTLQLEGSASDDHGVAKVTLRMRIKDSIELQPKGYREEEGKSFRFEDGSYPRTIEYKDFIELDKVKDTQGRPWPLHPGNVIEYWLEAADACDYPPPGPNVGKTEKTWKITIAAPEKDPKKTEQERKDAQQKKEEHKKNQDKELDKQNEQKKEQAQKQQPKQGDPKEGDPKQKNPDNANPEQPKQPNPEDKQFGDQKENVADKLRDEQDKGDGKGDKKSDPGQAKDQGPPQGPKEGQGDKKDGPGDSKDGPKPEDGKQQGDSKSPGNSGEKPAPPGDKGQAKAEPKPGDQPGNDPGQQGQGGTKQNGPPQGKPAGDKKDAGPKEAQQQASGEKGKGEGKASETAGESKNDGKNGAQDAKAGEPKGNGQQSQAQSNQTATGAIKDDPGARAKGEPKPGDNGPTKTKPEATVKGDPTGGQPGGPKQPNPDKKEPSGTAKGDPPPKKEPTSKDVADAAEKAKSDDKQTKDDALRQLQNMAQKAKDPQVKKEAEDALKKNGQAVAGGNDPKQPEKIPGQNPTGGGDAKPAPGGQDSTGESKVAGKGDPKEQGTPKEADPNAKVDPRKTGDTKPDQGGQAQPGEAKENGPDDGARGQGQGPRKTGPGAGTLPGDRVDPLTPVDTDPPEKANLADLRYNQKAGDLQLEEFKKRVTPDMLKKLNLTEAEWQKFLQEYQRRLQKLDTRVKDEEKRPRTGPGARNYPGVIKSRPTTGDRDNLQGIGPLLPPSEFQKSYQDFTEEMSRLKPKR